MKLVQARCGCVGLYTKEVPHQGEENEDSSGEQGHAAHREQLVRVHPSDVTDNDHVRNKLYQHTLVSE